MISAPRARLVEQRVRNEPIVDHRVGLAQAAERLHRDELGIAGAGADEGHERAHHGSTRTRTAQALSSGWREIGSRALSVRLFALFQNPWRRPQ